MKAKSINLSADLTEALKAQAPYSKRGRALARNAISMLDTTVSNVSVELQSEIDRLYYKNFRNDETTAKLSSQLAKIRSDYSILPQKMREDVDSISKNDFSITVFGRTMAGKSTLMEILTEGDGSSIGKGAQRTTLDVRKYQWNGLEITDVPGIGAFEGEDDEQIAFEAAKMADLILFLITDDAPQAVEAECFSRIVDLGKPVIVIMNVKKAIQDGKSLRFTEKEISKRFDMERLDKIRIQFCSFSEQYGQTWTHIPFVYVHLQSAFMSQKAVDRETKKSFRKISRIDYLKSRIVDQIMEKGEFYRIKTFIDMISIPVLESMENLLEQSQINSNQGRTLLAKRRQLEEWKSVFDRDGMAQIESLIVRIKSELYGEIASFAEEHFDDKNADKAWAKVLKSKAIETRCQELLEALEAKCNDKLKEVSREITNELRFVTSFARDKSLRMDNIINFKRGWDWGAVILGGGLSIGWGIATLCGAAAAGPLGWAAIAVGVIGFLGSLFITSRDKKEYEARLRLEKKLRENVDQVCKNLSSQMRKNLSSLESVRIEMLMTEMRKVNTVLFGLADTQKELAWDLNTKLMELSRQLITEAIRLIGAEGLEYHVQAVARIPGNTSLILLNDGTVFPSEQRDALQKIMAERIGFIYDSDNKKVLISRVIGKGIDRSKISIEEKIGVAHVPLQNATPYIKSRVRLAQQFSRVLIVNQ